MAVEVSFFVSADVPRRLLKVFFYVCVSMVSFVAIVLSFLYLIFWYLGKAVFRDCGLYWVTIYVYWLSVLHLLSHSSRCCATHVIAVGRRCLLFTDTWT